MSSGQSLEVSSRTAAPHLRESLFARDVDRGFFRARIGGEYLQHQGRFSHARIAAQQQRRAGHKSTAGDAVKLADTG